MAANSVGHLRTGFAPECLCRHETLASERCRLCYAARELEIVVEILVERAMIENVVLKKKIKSKGTGAPAPHCRLQVLRAL